MRILVVGDPYLDARTFAAAFAGLGDDHVVDYLQIESIQGFDPQTESERAIREYAGSPHEIISRMDGVEVLVVHGAPVTDEVLDASPDLRLVCCARGGPVNIDLRAANERAIPVATTPGKNAEAVAEQTVAFLIMLARGFPRAQRYIAGGGRLGGSAFEGVEFFGRELAGAALGLVGFGNVGREVARRARALGMRVAAFDPYLPARTDGPVDDRVGDLRLLLGGCDFVSLHARATPENENLFDRARFAEMRRGAFFVNTARETLVDEAALDEALASGQLAGAALDVLRPNGAAPHPLLRHANVIITPHIGGATHETLRRGAAMLAEEIRRFAAGEQLRHAASCPPARL